MTLSPRLVGGERTGIRSDATHRTHGRIVSLKECSPAGEFDAGGICYNERDAG
eukprot:CAMPEP_0180527788 /NCGR_PEP_ID=MMETSP1036_2-20121128/60428_1 /TAXON_ID=632150 /ORGANISM="Azadinium spinosum, Strain 3D9" /LENGTH=52 /DNA_ID=CAMNT_0022541257 /DNA_START=93 /DNA_END=251 /DNA_ORIENTATION=+